MLVEEIITETHSDHISHLLSRDRGVRKRDVESDIDTIKTFGYKPDKRNVYKGKNPAGIPVYQRSITRVHDSDTGDDAVYRRSTRYAGPESEESREKETYDGPRHMMPKHLRRVKEDGEMCEPEKDKDGNEVCVVPMGDENLTAAEKKAADARDEEMWDYEDGLSDKQWNIYDNAMSKYIRSGVKNKTAYKAYLFARQQVEKTEVRGSTVAPPNIEEGIVNERAIMDPKCTNPETGDSPWYSHMGRCLDANMKVKKKSEKEIFDAFASTMKIVSQKPIEIEDNMYKVTVKGMYEGDSIHVKGVFDRYGGKNIITLPDDTQMNMGYMFTSASRKGPWKFGGKNEMGPITLKTVNHAFGRSQTTQSQTKTRGLSNESRIPFRVIERVLTTAQKLTQMQHYWDNLSHLAPDETKKKSLNTRFGIFNIKLDKNKIVSFDCCRHGYSEGKSPHKKGTKKYKNHMAAIHAGESIETISEVSPPGREKQVEKLKQKYGADSDVPFKIAWAQHNKHGVPKK